MKIKLKAPEGYKYRDTRNNRDYAEIIVTDSERDRFVLVPALDEQIIKM